MRAFCSAVRPGGLREFGSYGVLLLLASELRRTELPDRKACGGWLAAEGREP